MDPELLALRESITIRAKSGAPMPYICGNFSTRVHHSRENIISFLDTCLADITANLYPGPLPPGFWHVDLKIRRIERLPTSYLFRAIPSSLKNSTVHVFESDRGSFIAINESNTAIAPTRFCALIALGLLVARKEAMDG